MRTTNHAEHLDAWHALTAHDAFPRDFRERLTPAVESLARGVDLARQATRDKRAATTAADAARGDAARELVDQLTNDPKRTNALAIVETITKLDQLAATAAEVDKLATVAVGHLRNRAEAIVRDAGLALVPAIGAVRVATPWHESPPACAHLAWSIVGRHCLVRRPEELCTLDTRNSTTSLPLDLPAGMAREIVLWAWDAVAQGEYRCRRERSRTIIVPVTPYTGPVPVLAAPEVPQAPARRR